MCFAYNLAFILIFAVLSLYLIQKQHEGSSIKDVFTERRRLSQMRTKADKGRE